jgi:hypothetical protein
MTTSGGPVFLIGSMRSGSTMLRLILDSHPSIAVPAETGFMGALAATRRIPNWNYGERWFERLGWSEEEFDELLHNFYVGLFDRFARDQGKSRWGEKTPFHTAHLATMGKVFPDAQFVGIVRHPGAVASSLRKRFHYTFPEALAYWLTTNLEMVRGASGLGQRFVLCRYEDLVEDGEPVLRQLTSFLGEPWAPEMLEHHRVQQAKGAPRAVEGSTISTEPIDRDRAVAWTSSARPEDIEGLAVTAGLAKFFGYDPIEASPRAPWPNGGLLAGNEIAALRRSWAGQVDFEAQAPPLLLDAPAEELAARLAQAEAALARTRSRRAVRYVDALRKLQHGRSRQDLVTAWRLARSG